MCEVEALGGHVLRQPVDVGADLLNLVLHARGVVDRDHEVGRAAQRLRRLGHGRALLEPLPVGRGAGVAEAPLLAGVAGGPVRPHDDAAVVNPVAAVPVLPRCRIVPQPTAASSTARASERIAFDMLASFPQVKETSATWPRGRAWSLIRLLQSVRPASGRGDAATRRHHEGRGRALFSLGVRATYTHSQSGLRRVQRRTPRRPATTGWKSAGRRGKTGQQGPGPLPAPLTPRRSTVAYSDKARAHYDGELKTISSAGLFKDERYIHAPQGAEIEVEFPAGAAPQAGHQHVRQQLPRPVQPPDGGEGGARRPRRARLRHVVGALHLRHPGHPPELEKQADRRSWAPRTPSSSPRAWTPTAASSRRC